MFQSVRYKINFMPKLILYLFVFFISFAIVILLDGIDPFTNMNNALHVAFLNFNENRNTSFQNYDDALEQGWLSFNAGDFTKSRLTMTKVFRETKEISALYCLAMIDMKEGKTQAAIEKLEQVYINQPKHISTLLNLSRLYYNQRYYIRAEDLLDKALKIEPQNAEIRLLLGKIYLKKGDKESALPLFKSITNGEEGLEAEAIIEKLCN